MISQGSHLPFSSCNNITDLVHLRVSAASLLGLQAAVHCPQTSVFQEKYGWL